MITTPRLVLVSALAVALSACQTLSPEQTNNEPVPTTQSTENAEGFVLDTVLATPNVPLEEMYPLAEPVVADNPETPDIVELAPSIAQTGWRDFYGDEKLKALIELGLANNKNLEQAIIAIKKAESQYQISRNQSLPTAGLSGGYSRSANQRMDANPSSAYSVGLGMASYELDFWGKVSSLKEQALQNYLATNAAKDSAQIALVAGIAQSYANLSYAKAQLMLAESTVKSRERSLFITKKRFDAGIDSKSPSLQAESSLESARLAVMNAQTAVLKAQNALQFLIGAPVPMELMPEPAITGLIAPKVLSTGLPSELLYYRPDILQAEHALKAAGANINVARAAFFPSISLSGNVGLASGQLKDLFKLGGASWSFGPSINLPIFDAGARRANYEVSQLEEKQRLSAYEGAIQNAFREVNDVLADRATLNEQLKSQYKLQANYQRTYDIAYATFRSGLSSYLDVLDAERSLFAVQQSILQMEQQKVLSQIALYQVLGGGADLTVAQITSADEQSTSMAPARMATQEEVKALSEAQASPINPSADEPSSVPSTTKSDDKQPDNKKSDDKKSDDKKSDDKKSIETSSTTPPKITPAKPSATSK